MSYMLHIVANTTKSIGLMDFLSADPHRLKRAWPQDHITMQDVLDAGIDQEDYNWFLNDMEHAKITRVEGAKWHRQDGAAHYRVVADDIQDTTPEVLSKLQAATNRLGHPYFGSAFFLTGGRIHSVDAGIPLHRLQYDGSFNGPQGDEYGAGL